MSLEERMCPCHCGMTFEEAVVTLIEDGNTREESVTFLSDETIWK